MTDWLPEDATEWSGRAVVHKIADAVARHRAGLCGTVRRVEVRRTTHGTSFDAWIDDGTGELVLRWTGRDGVAGVVPGAALLVEGTIVSAGPPALILNPLYRFEADGASTTSTS